MGARHLAANLLDKVPLGVEGLEPIQRSIGSFDHGMRDLVPIPHALMVVGEPLLSLPRYKIIKRGAVFEISHRGADSRSGPVEIDLGPAQHASSLFKLSLEDLSPQLSGTP